MAASGSSTGSGSPATAPDSFTMSAEKHAKDWIANSPQTLGSINYNWLPFCTALCEEAVDISKLVNPQDTIDELEDTDLVSDVLIENLDPGQRPVKDPHSGSWEHTWYVPEWTHPDWDSKVETRYTGARSVRTNTEVLSGLRPALRPEDVIRQPTDYARRFGIHPDEIGGRSRLSPTLSKTRDPFEDYANQIEQLSDQEKQECIEESKKYFDANGGVDPYGKNLILPSVIEIILERFGAIGNARLPGELRKALEEQNVTLEQFVDTLNSSGSIVTRAHPSYFDNALNDQDYQRLLFIDLTTDELIQNNIHTMSNAAFSDLRGPVHSLFQRDRWESSDWKGEKKHNPRYLYNLNGVREEWDVQNNDAVWNALQPALLLVTKILDSEPPHLAAVANMETRQRIDPSQDARSEPQTASLLKYVMEKDIDLTKTLPELAELNQLGYDWKANTMRVLQRHLRVDIGSCYILPGYYPNDPEAVDGVVLEDGVTYGVTRRVEAGEDSHIMINIGAELIWPLLAEGFSESEKLCCSFVIATTLLHELCHAVNFAHQMLTVYGWIHPPDQPEEVTELVQQLYSELWDYEWSRGEPYFEETGDVELGSEFEKSLWGFTLSTLLHDHNKGVSRHVQSMPIAAAFNNWPASSTPGTVKTGQRRGCSHPVEDWNYPIPSDYINKFFTEDFWNNEFQIYGHEALKQLPPDRVHKASMRPHHLREKNATSLFGEQEWKFLKTIPRLFVQNDRRVMSSYMYSSIFDVMRRADFLARYIHEVKNWKDETLDPLDDSADTLLLILEQSQKIHNMFSSDAAGQAFYYNQYVGIFNNDLMVGRVNGAPASFANWQAALSTQWGDVFMNGGIVMRQVAETYRLMQTDLAFLQRMIFDFFNISYNQRDMIYNGNGSADAGPIGAAYARLIFFRSVADRVCSLINDICESPALLPIRGFWDQWRARIQATSRMYVELLQMLGRERSVDVDDVSWKARFNKLPSSYWKNRSERLRRLAAREYIKLDPRIRQAVDDWSVALRAATNKVDLFPDKTQVEDITELLSSIATPTINPQAPGKSKMGGLFNFVAPTTAPAGAGASTTPNIGTAAPLPPPQPAPMASTGGIIFGQPARVVSSASPSNPLGASPSRRTRTARGVSSPLGPKSGSGVKKVSSGRRGSGFGKFNDNSQIHPLFDTARKLAPVTGAGGSAPAPLEVFGPGGPIVSTGATQSAFPPRAGNVSTLRPFPDAYATPITLTSEVLRQQTISRQNQESSQAVAAAMGLVQPTYATTQMYRDMGLGGSPASSRRDSPESKRTNNPFASDR